MTDAEIEATLKFGGGSLARNTSPKIRRPLDAALPIHLVLKAERSAMRTPRNRRRVDDLVTEVTSKHGVRLYQYANVGNHLHLLIKIPTRAAWAAFIRELTGRIARLTGVAWASRPFTRAIESWGRAFRTVEAYVALNHFEAERKLNKEEARALRRLRQGDQNRMSSR